MPELPLHDEADAATTTLNDLRFVAAYNLPNNGTVMERGEWRPPSGVALHWANGFLPSGDCYTFWLHCNERDPD
jgi:hypothetical protein